MKQVLARVYYAIGPIGAGAVLDILDVATYGPVGLLIGGLVGGLAGWVLADCEGLGPKTRNICVAAAAVYMTIPLTEPIPVGTTLGVLSRLFRQPRTDSPARSATDASTETDHTKND